MSTDRSPDREDSNSERLGSGEAITFTAVRKIPASAQSVWSALTDWKRHEDWIPATTISFDQGRGDQPGDVFTAVSGLGPLRLVDIMRIESFEPPSDRAAGRCVISKISPSIGGCAVLTIEPVDSNSCQVSWFEAVTPAGPRWLWTALSMPLGWGGKVAFGMTLRAVERYVIKL